MSKRTTNPKSLKFVVIRQHMKILSLKDQVKSKNLQIQKLEGTIRRLRRKSWFGRLIEKIKKLFKGNNA